MDAWTQYNQASLRDCSGRPTLVVAGELFTKPETVVDAAWHLHHLLEMAGARAAAAAALPPRPGTATACTVPAQQPSGLLLLCLPEPRLALAAAGVPNITRPSLEALEERVLRHMRPAGSPAPLPSTAGDSSADARGMMSNSISRRGGRGGGPACNSKLLQSALERSIQQDAGSSFQVPAETAALMAALRQEVQRLYQDPRLPLAGAKAQQHLKARLPSTAGHVLQEWQRSLRLSP